MEEHFTPVGIRNPSRRKKCDAFALSFYRTVDEARAKINELNQSGHGNIETRLGTRIAPVEVTQQDGVSSEFDEEGHMNLHPEEGVTFVHRLNQEDFVMTVLEVDEAG